MSDKKCTSETDAEALIKTSYTLIICLFPLGNLIGVFQYPDKFSSLVIKKDWQ
jgi:hypothetical protein